MDIMKSICKFKTGDCGKLSDLIIKTLRTSNSGDYSPGQIDRFISEYSPEKILYYSKSRTIYVAVENNKIVATISMAKHNKIPGCAILLSLFVDPEHQGCGIGTDLVKYAEREALTYPADTIVVPSSLTAHEFYKKLGYVDDDQTDDINAINIWMYKALKK